MTSAGPVGLRPLPESRRSVAFTEDGLTFWEKLTVIDDGVS